MNVIAVEKTDIVPGDQVVYVMHASTETRHRQHFLTTGNVARAEQYVNHFSSSSSGMNENTTGWILTIVSNLMLFFIYSYLILRTSTFSLNTKKLQERDPSFSACFSEYRKQIYRNIFARTFERCENVLPNTETFQEPISEYGVMKKRVHLTNSTTTRNVSVISMWIPKLCSI